MTMTETWERLWSASNGKLQEWLTAKDEEKLLPVIRSVFGEGAGIATYVNFARDYYAAKEAGERLAELVVVYGAGVTHLHPDVQEQLRLAIPYARGCHAALAAAKAVASNGRDVPGIETCRALTNRDDAEAKRLYLSTLAQKMVARR